MDGDGQTINLLREPTIEERLRIAARAERTAISTMMLDGTADTDIITAAEGRAQLFEAMADERMTQRLAGATATPTPSSCPTTWGSCSTPRQASQCACSSG